MAQYKVKTGHHSILGKVYKTGDVVEAKGNEKMAEGDGARFFEKLAEPVAAPEGEGGKRGRKPKAEAGEAAATTGAGEGTAVAAAKA